jgi:hypothetical protein
LVLYSDPMPKKSQNIQKVKKNVKVEDPDNCPANPEDPENPENPRIPLNVMDKKTTVKKNKGTQSKPEHDEKKSNDEDSSDISDIDENDSISDAFAYDVKKSTSNQNDINDEAVQKEYVQTVVLDGIIKYIKIDDIIKKKQAAYKKEMKTIKDSKDQLEQFLLGYLDKIGEEYIHINNKGTLMKTEVKTKAPPKMEEIQNCLFEGFKKYELYEDEDELKRVVKDFVFIIDSKREIKTRKFIKRLAGNPDDSKRKGAKKNEKKENVDVESSNHNNKRKYVKKINKNNQ